MTYRTFTRTWWKSNPAWPNGLEPELGERTYSEEEYETEDEARTAARAWNAENDPGRFSLKMEIEEC